MADPFQLFGVEPSFRLDLESLEQRHRELSRALHPDRYAGSAPGERRQALSRAIEVNEAWRVLRDPIRRAEALCRLRGWSVGEGQEPRADPLLLMEMMEQREALADARRARDLERVTQLASGVRNAEAAAVERLAGLLDAPQSAPEAVLQQLGSLRYYRRFLEEAAAIEDDLC